MTESKGPLHVLHLRDSPWVDGPGRTILETASSIDRTRIDYHVGAFVRASGTDHPLVAEMRNRGLPVHEVIDDGVSLRKVARQVVALIDELHVDILHTSEFRSNVIGLLCRRRREVRLVSTAHGWIANDLRGKLKTMLDRIQLRRFDHVILVSNAMRCRLPAWWVPDSRIRILHNALALERFGPGTNRSKRGAPAPGDRVTVLNVGRLSAEKGQEMLLRAIAALADDYPALRLVFAGIGPLEAELKKLADELRIANRISFLGYVTDVATLYESADLIVQSSLTEGLPNVVLEALHLGVPVVATDVGGTREVVDHGLTGWLIPPRSLAAMISGIRAFLERPAEFIKMGQAGRARIEARFSIDRRTTAQMAVYEGLVGIRA